MRALACTAAIPDLRAACTLLQLVVLVHSTDGPASRAARHLATQVSPTVDAEFGLGQRFDDLSDTGSACGFVADGRCNYLCESVQRLTHSRWRRAVRANYATDDALRACVPDGLDEPIACEGVEQYAAVGQRVSVLLVCAHGSHSSLGHQLRRARPLGYRELAQAAVQRVAPIDLDGRSLKACVHPR
eukprot:scaffold74378_cov71-Phaeocystis_antarctica.AAC.2